MDVIEGEKRVDSILLLRLTRYIESIIISTGVEVKMMLRIAVESLILIC